MEELPAAHQANIRLGQSEHRDRRTIARHELDLIGTPVSVAMNNGTDITLAEAVLPYVPIEDNHIELGNRTFFAHRITSRDTQ